MISRPSKSYIRKSLLATIAGELLYRRAQALRNYWYLKGGMPSAERQQARRWILKLSRASHEFDQWMDYQYHQAARKALTAKVCRGMTKSQAKATRRWLREKRPLIRANP